MHIYTYDYAHTKRKNKKIRVRKGTKTNLDTRDAAVATSCHITPAHHIPSALKASAQSTSKEVLEMSPTYAPWKEGPKAL